MERFGNKMTIIEVFNRVQLNIYCYVVHSVQRCVNE